MAGGVDDGKAVGRAMAVGSALPMLQADIKTAITVRMGMIFFMRLLFEYAYSICREEIQPNPPKVV
jgi:hypothetical protein